MSSPKSAVADEFVFVIKDEINRMVDEKIIMRLKNPNYKIDKDAIRRECESRFFKELEETLKKEEVVRNKFFECLQQDNPELLEAITQAFSAESDNQAIQNFPDLVNKSPIILGDTIIQELKKLGVKFFEEKNHERAFCYFTALTVFEPTNPDFWLLNALAEHNLNHYPEAVSSYLQTIVLAPNYPFAYVQCILCLIKANEMEDAKMMYDGFLKAFEPSEYTTAELDPEIKKINALLVY